MVLRSKPSSEISKPRLWEGEGGHRELERFFHSDGRRLIQRMSLLRPYALLAASQTSLRHPEKASPESSLAQDSAIDLCLRDRIIYFLSLQEEWNSQPKGLLIPYFFSSIQWFEKRHPLSSEPRNRSWRTKIEAFMKSKSGGPKS